MGNLLNSTIITCMFLYAVGVLACATASWSVGFNGVLFLVGLGLSVPFLYLLFQIEYPEEKYAQNRTSNKTAEFGEYEKGEMFNHQTIVEDPSVDDWDESTTYDDLAHASGQPNWDAYCASQSHNE